MDSSFVLRLALLVRLVAFMALIYLALDALVARLSRKPGSRLRWFFELITSPLTAPVRRMLPDATPGQVRIVTGVLLGMVWLGAAWLSAASAVVGLGAPRVE